MPLFGRGRPSSRLTISSPTKSDQRTAPRALTASGGRVSRKNADLLRRLIQPWQTRALSYYDQIGELKFAAQFYARMLTPLQIFAAEKVENDDGTVAVEPTKNVDVIRQVERIQDPGGGRQLLLGSYGRLMFLTGETYLLCSKDEDGIEQWEMLSTDELRLQGSTMLRYKAPSLPVTEYREPDDDDYEPMDAKEAVAYRIWQRHPRWSSLADSTMYGVLDIAEELLLLTHAVRSRAKSRIGSGAGVLWINDKLSPPPDEPAPDEDPQEDPLMVALIEAVTTAIKDEGSAAAVAPLIVRVPVPNKADGTPVPISDLIYLQQLIDPMQLYPETGLRMECIRRLALGLDLPPEILLGTGDVNHWGQWLIDEQTWKSHGQQKAQQLCDDLAAAFLRPTLRDAGIPDWQRYCIGYDASGIINHPSRATDAKDLYDRRAISKEALREANGFEDSDAPSVDELQEMIGVAVRDGSLALFGIPTVKGGTIETEPGVIESPTGGEAEAPTGTQAHEVEPGPPKSGPPGSEPAPPGSVVGGMLEARILGASEMGFLRAREVAGNRIRTQAKRDKDLAALLRDVRPGQAAATVGIARLHALFGHSNGGSPGSLEVDLVSGARDLILDAFRYSQVSESIAEAVTERILEHAARTLYEPVSGLTSTFASYVRGLVADMRATRR